MIEYLLIVINVLFGIFTLVSVKDAIKKKESIVYYLNLARMLAHETTCRCPHSKDEGRGRGFASVAVLHFGTSQEQVIGTGVNISSNGSVCRECKRSGASRGQQYGACPAIHGETNSILECFSNTDLRSLEDVTIFSSSRGSTEGMLQGVPSAHPCINCAEVINITGVKDFYGFDDNGKVEKWNRKDCYGGLTYSPSVWN